MAAQAAEEAAAEAEAKAAEKAAAIAEQEAGGGGAAAWRVRGGADRLGDQRISVKMSDLCGGGGGCRGEEDCKPEALHR